MNFKNQQFETSLHSKNVEHLELEVDQNQLELQMSQDDIEEQKQSSPDNLQELRQLNQQIQLELEQEQVIDYSQKPQQNNSKIKYKQNLSYTQFEQQEKVETVSKKVVCLAIVLTLIGQTKNRFLQYLIKGLALLILGIVQAGRYNKVTLGVTFWILALICLMPGIYIIYKIFKISCTRNDEKKILERRQLPDWS